MLVSWKKNAHSSAVRFRRASEQAFALSVLGLVAPEGWVPRDDRVSVARRNQSSILGECETVDVRCPPRDPGSQEVEPSATPLLPSQRRTSAKRVSRGHHAAVGENATCQSRGQWSSDGSVGLHPSGCRTSKSSTLSRVAGHRQQPPVGRERECPRLRPLLDFQVGKRSGCFRILDVPEADLARVVSRREDRAVRTERNREPLRCLVRCGLHAQELQLPRVAPVSQSET